MLRIRELRKTLGIKQETLAKATGVKQSSVSDWENGVSNPTIENLISMSRYFKVTVGCIVGEEPIPPDFPTRDQISDKQSENPSPVQTKKQYTYELSYDQIRIIEAVANKAARKAAMEAVKALREDVAQSSENIT